jgi:hypothetical protein
MKNILCILFLSICIICFIPVQGNTQEVQPEEQEAVQPEPVTDDDIIELGVEEIQIKIEKPQVLLFSSRIKPEFDEVNLEKSFMTEIVGGSEKIVFDFSKSKQPIERIDVSKLLSKYKR